VTPTALRLALAQINLCVGDIEGNTAQILAAIDESRRLGAGLVLFPELAITGYPPEDLLFRPELHRRVTIALAKIQDASAGLTAIVGHPERAADGLFNSASVFTDGKLDARYRKQRLPNYAVFDEKRYFLPGASPCVIEAAGLRLGLSICEDIWDPATAVANREAGANLILNLNASPFSLRKREQRYAALEAARAASGLPIVYLNLVGGQDELVFDGGSVVMDAGGEIVVRAEDFKSQILTVDVSTRDGKLVFTGPRAPVPDEVGNLYAALTLGVRDYVHKNRFRGAVIGLSGGIDSALTLALAVDALGAENVMAVSMPSRYTADMSIEDALAQARAMGCECHVVPIEKPFSAFVETLQPVLGEKAFDVTEENLQARCRGVLLMALSNSGGRLVLTTGNKSEMSVGYATLYGDMAGGFAPLKDCPKLLVYRLCVWRNRHGEVIPQRVIDRPPSAELRPDQKDSDSLPPYEVLDPILEMYIEQDRTPQEIVAAGFDAAAVRRVAGLVDRSEYKRRQAAPGVRVTERAFGRDRRFPITSRYSELDPG
jgi:NAD+ synthase (glutamine-hydrolysing)